jgi:hypothetical protein
MTYRHAETLEPAEATTGIILLRHLGRPALELFMFSRLHTELALRVRTLHTVY